MKTVVSKLRTMLGKTTDVRIVGDIVVFLALCATFSGNPAEGTTAFISLLTLTILLTVRILGMVDASLSIEPLPRTTIHLFRGVPAVVSAAVCFLVIVPYIVSYEAVWAVLWSVFGGYLLLSGVTSLISFGKLKIRSRREARKTLLDDRLTELRRTLIAVGE